MLDAAIVLANDRYRTPNGKTAHGLVRGGTRFRVLAVIDPDAAGHDAGELLDGIHREIPIVATMDEALSLEAQKPRYCVVGVATHGGRFTPELRELVREAVDRGLSIVNGLHDAASEDEEIAALARSRGVELIDLRRPKPKHELHFWEGYVHNVRAPRLAVLGTDCALGKRTTTVMLVDTLREAGVQTEMIYTGQTGWMQGARFGFVFDATLNDYVSGELEHAIVTCDREAAPDLMVIEGQSSLRNPSGPCGSEFLLSGAARGVVLQHAAGRTYFEGYEQQRLRIPPLEDEIALIELYGARTLAVTLNGDGLSREELERYRRRTEERLAIPVVSVLEEGPARLIPVVQRYIETEMDRHATSTSG